VNKVRGIKMKKQRKGAPDKAERDRIFMLRWGQSTTPADTRQKPLMKINDICKVVVRAPGTVKDVLDGEYDRVDMPPHFIGCMTAFAEIRSRA